MKAATCPYVASARGREGASAASHGEGVVKAVATAGVKKGSAYQEENGDHVEEPADVTVGRAGRVAARMRLEDCAAAEHEHQDVLRRMGGVRGSIRASEPSYARETS